MITASVNDEFLARQTLLVLAPHADDEVIGCAGTIAKIKDLGGKVYVMVLSIGDLRFCDGKDSLVPGEARRKEFEATAEFLGLDGYDIVFDDSESHLRLDAMPRRDLIGKIERDSKVSIQKTEPTMVALPAPSYNQDHAAVFQAGFTACRPLLQNHRAFQNVVLSYDSPTLFWDPTSGGFRPNLYIDVTKYLDTKLKAMSFHESQLRESPHHYSLDNIERLARFRGREISVEAAEAFVCHRFVL